MVGTSILVCLAAVLLYGCGHCCYCNDFYYLSWNFGPTINISLESSTELTVRARRIDVYDCEDIKAYWEIVRAGGEVEVYTALSQEYDYRRDEEFQDRGLSLYARCRIRCQLYLTLNPTDLRYDGSNISLVFNFSECYSTPNITNSTTLRIQGLLEAPRGVTVETVGIETVNVSWSPPFTLDGVPILHYSVYVTSGGLTAQYNITEMHITLRRPCASTTYQISGWNEVGEGNATTYEWTMFEATVRSVREQEMCLFRSFATDPMVDCQDDATAEGCAVKLRNENLTISFNITRQNPQEVVLAECFSVPQAGVFSANVYEIHQGLAQEHTSRQLNNVVIENTSPIQADVRTMSGGICASCYFSRYLTLSGCAIRLHSDKHTYNFNMPRQSIEDLALLECFPVPQAGVFHVVVYEVQPDGSVGPHSLVLPDIKTTKTTPKSDQENTVVVVVLSILFGLTLLGLVAAILLLVRGQQSRKTKSPTHSIDTGSPGERMGPETEPRPSTLAFGEMPTYEDVEMKHIRRHDEIKVTFNAAYGRVGR
jgi:hypothetical protein